MAEPTPRACTCKHSHGPGGCPVLDCECLAYRPQPPGWQTLQVVQVIELCDDCAPKVEATVRRLKADVDRLTAERDEARSHIEDIAAHATPYGDIPGEPGWVGTYLLTAGALHRALGKLGHTAPSCQAEAERDRVAAARDRQVRRAEIAEGMVHRVYAGIGKLLDPILGTVDEGRDEGLVEGVERALRLVVAAELRRLAGEMAPPADRSGLTVAASVSFEVRAFWVRVMLDRAAELDPEGGA